MIMFPIIVQTLLAATLVVTALDSLSAEVGGGGRATKQCFTQELKSPVVQAPIKG